jgi:large subunit ribosomal protein L9
LFPRNLAVEANRRNLHTLEHEKRVLGLKADRERQSAEAVKARLDGLVLTVRALAGETGRLFGSVTNLDVERLLAEKGFAIDRRRILLKDPIKDLGVHAVTVHIGNKVRATVQVTVEAETPPATEG